MPMNQILAMDVNRVYFELGLPVTKKADVAHKIDFREGIALPVLDESMKDVSSLLFHFLTLFSSFLVITRVTSHLIHTHKIRAQTLITKGNKSLRPATAPF